MNTSSAALTPLIAWMLFSAQIAEPTDACTVVQTCSRQHSGTDSSRYGRAARSIAGVQLVKNLATASEQAFTVLDDVSQTGLTQWSLLNQPGQRRLTFRTTGNRQRRWIDLDDLELSSFDQGSRSTRSLNA